MQRIEKQVSINASRLSVWDALTNLASMSQWMGVPEMRLTVVTDWQVGSPILITGFHHAQFSNTGTILRIEPEQALCYTHLSSLSRLPDEPHNYSSLCFALEEASLHTAVTLTIDNFPTEAIYKHLNFYWSTTILMFKRFVEQHQGSEDAQGRQGIERNESSTNHQ